MVSSFKEVLISLPVFSLPRSTGLFTLDRDACDKNRICTFLQVQEDGRNRYVGYLSKTLNGKEQELPTTIKCS